MRLIILSGAENCGKTHALNMLAEKIFRDKRSECVRKIPKGNPKNNDWEYVISSQHDGKEKRLVISTWGDYWWILNACCKLYSDYDAVVCACNMEFMRGRTRRPFVDAMNYDPLATVVMKSCEPDSDKYDVANEQCSDYLFDLIEYFGII